MAGKAGKTLRKTAFYPYRPEQVWVALTDPRAIAEWLMPNDFVPVIGHKFRFQTDPNRWCGDGYTQCEVLELDAPRRLVYSWVKFDGQGHPTHAPTIVSWTLSPERHGTRLEFQHSGIEALSLWMRLLMGMGWGGMIKGSLPKVLPNVKDGGEFVPGAIPMKKRYYKAETLPPNLIR